MKRILLFTGLLILLFLVTAAVVVGSAFMGRQAIADGAEMNGIRVVKDSIVTIGIVPVATGQVALIDAGNDPAGKAILAALTQRGLGPDAVTAILLTHGHQDHTGGIHLFPKAQVMAMKEDVGLVEGTAKPGGPLTRLMPLQATGVKVSRALQDGDTITLGDVTIRAYAVPGHTQGSAAYLVNGVLFIGDAADMKADGTIQGSAWIFTDDQAQDRASLVNLDKRLKQENADVKAVEFAHEGLAMNGMAALDAFR
jgi:glyoxylase-like metal-dependent hydrolase (beta-lactamase superfamily II)